MSFMGGLVPMSEPLRSDTGLPSTSAGLFLVVSHGDKWRHLKQKWEKQNDKDNHLNDTFKKIII